MRFLAIPGIVSLPLLTIQGSKIDIVYGPYELLSENFTGFNGNVLFVTKYAPKMGVRIRWLLGRNYVWVWERSPWIRNDAKVGTLNIGSTSDVMFRTLVVLLGVNVQVINYEDLNELISDYDAGKIDALILPVIHMHRINDAPSYPIDRLFIEYLGQSPLTPYAIAIKDEAYMDIKALYEEGIRNIMRKTDIKVLQELLSKFDIQIPESTLNFILSNVKFNLINVDSENNLVNLINKVYGGMSDMIDKTIIKIFD